MAQYIRSTDEVAIVENVETPTSRPVTDTYVKSDTRYYFITAITALSLFLIFCLASLIFLVINFIDHDPCVGEYVTDSMNQSHIADTIWEVFAKEGESHHMDCLVDEYILVVGDQKYTGVRSTTHGVPALGMNVDEVYKQAIGRPFHINTRTTPVGEFNALDVTAIFDHSDISRLFILLRADVNATASEHKTTSLQVAAYYNSINVAKFLIQNHADVSHADRSGSTALHSVAHQGSLVLAVMLLDAKANVDAVNHKGDTPLHTAAKHNHFVMAELLLSRGANAEIMNHAGYKPRDLTENSAIHELLWATELGDASHNILQH